jgi:hypothetical protein
MIYSARGILQSGFEIVSFQIGHFFEYLLSTETRCIQVQDVNDSDSHSANAGASTALVWVDCYAIQ